MQTNNIIAIRQNDIHAADKAFAEFMSYTEAFLNEKSSKDTQLLKNCGGQQLESVALQALKEVAPLTPFRRENIKLVSGARFPDIVAEKFYGVEVKSTKSDTWHSTGSSIVENTRIEDVSRIYMLFGKLGGECAEFRCRPYERCLSGIAVTHSPRYLIDMDIADKKDQSIFSKMNVDYDTFRLMKEKPKIDFVRDYFKRKAQQEKRIEMPWWIGGGDESISMNISLYSDLARKDKDAIDTRMFILFPEVFQRNYKRAAIWLCSRYALICPNMRDLFTAGGKVKRLGDIELKAPVPQIAARLYKYKYGIKILLKQPDMQLMQDIRDYWNIKEEIKDFHRYWLDVMKTIFDNDKELSQIPLNEMFQ